MKKEAKLFFCAVLLISVPVVLAFLEPLISPDKILYFNDVIHVWFFFKYFTAQALNKFGALPLWNPLIFSGVPLAGNPQSTFFYPPFILFYLAPVQWAVTVLFVLHLIFAGTGMYLFARMKNMRFGVSLFCAAVFVMNWKVTSHVFAGHLTQTSAWAYIPWLFICIDKFARNPGIKPFAGLSVCCCMLFLCGQMQVFYYATFAGSAYGAYLIIKNRNNVIKKTAGYIGAMVLGMVLSAVSLVPILEMTRYFQRSGGTDFSFAASYSLKWSDFITLFYPCFFVSPEPGSNITNQLFWEYAVYAGLMPLFLLFVSYKPAKKADSGFFILLLLFCVLFSLGQSTPFFKIMYYAVPGVKYFRCPARMYLLAGFALALLSGFGLKFVIENRTSKPVLNLTAAVFVAGLIFSTLHIIFQVAGYTVNGSIRTPAILIISAVLLFIYSKKFIGSNVFCALAISIVLFDLGAISYPLIKSVPLSEVFPARKIHEPLLADKSIYRIFDLTGAFPQYLSAYYGIQQIGGDEPVMLEKYINYMLACYNMRDYPSKPVQRKTYELFPLGDLRRGINWTLLDLLNVKYLITPYHLEHDFLIKEQSCSLFDMNTKFLEGMYPIIKSNLKKYSGVKTYLYRNENVLPRAFLLANPDGAQNPDFLINKFFSTGRKNMFPAQILSYQPDKIVISTHSDMPSYLITSEIMFPGWQAKIDGCKTRIHKLKKFFRSVELTAGKHKVVFYYRPSSFYAGIAISVSGLAVLIFLAVLSFIKNTGDSADSKPDFTAGAN